MVITITHWFFHSGWSSHNDIFHSSLFTHKHSSLWVASVGLSSSHLFTPCTWCCYRNITLSMFFFFHWHYGPLWALALQTMSFHFFLSATISLHLLTPSTWRSLSTSSFHLFLGLPLLLVPSSSWVKIFLGILSSSILSRWPNQLILCPFIHFTIFSSLLISSSSRCVRLFHSSFSYLGPYILLLCPYDTYFFTIPLISQALFILCIFCQMSKF